MVIRNLEDDLPIDFGCVCLYDPEAGGADGHRGRSEEGAGWPGTAGRSDGNLDREERPRALRPGHLVYESDTQAGGRSPSPSELAAQNGLRALVVAPLLLESQVFGVLIAARRAPHSFSSPDCEFLRQLERARRAGGPSGPACYAALQQAYDELRQSQQTVLQQERLRALGQMASGIAHDINNAISPVALYTESLLETRTGSEPPGPASIWRRSTGPSRTWPRRSHGCASSTGSGSRSCSSPR